MLGLGQLGNLGLAGGLLDPAPAWVLRGGGLSATLDVDFLNDLAWNANATTTIAALLACAANSSSRYYTKADGTLQSFAANTLRYGTNGLLVEASRTNICLRSQEIGNPAVWASAGSPAVTVDATAAPDGTTTADLVQQGAGGGFYVQDITGAISTSYIWSIYAKPSTNTTRYLIYVGGGGAGGSDGGVRFNATTGAVVATIGTIDASGAEVLANGWVRFWIKFTTNGVDNTFGLIMQATDNSNNLNNCSAYYWGAQCEAGASISSYIPAVSASATRAADVITFSDLTWFDGAAESVYAEWKAKGVVGAKVISLDATNNVFLDEQSGISPKVSDEGVTFAITTGNTGSADATLKAAMRLATNDVALCLNGGTVGTDTSATTPGTLTAARLGCDLSSANHLNSYVRRIAAWKSVLLSDSALQAVST